jgi:TMEM175 potassium channel family protein
VKPDRLNAFTDGVIAIAITIMVLEIRLPHEPTFAGFLTMAPLLGIYALSFVNVGIFWANHHHLLQDTTKIDGSVLWANLFLLFWLSLIPFEIRWMGEAGLVAWPVAAYGGVLMMSAAAYLLLERTLIRAEGDGSRVGAAVGSRGKEWLSFALYAFGFAAAFLISPYVSVACYVIVAVIWLVPDRRFEKRAAE